MEEITKIESIDQYDQLFGLETLHPLVNVIDFSKATKTVDYYRMNIGFYSLFLKDAKCGDLRYGRKYYDYQEGTVVCMAPGQVIGIDNRKQTPIRTKSIGLLFHPDLIRGTSLGQNIKHYSFFSYEVNEALHLSEQEREIVTDCIHKIQIELEHAIDKHSKQLIVRNIELLLDYCMRFYERQFITRNQANKDIIVKFEQLLDEYFQNQTALTEGLPSVKYFADKVCLSSNYFGDLIKKETGKTAQEYIQHRIIELAKERILEGSQTVSQICNMPIPANKAIVGTGAFAHSSGIHQDGVLKNRENYEIMTPESIGLNQVQLNLTSRSGRAAVKHRMEEMGYKDSDYNMDQLYDAFLKLADKKGQVFDYDLEALAFINKQQEEPEHFRLDYFNVQSGSSDIATASVKLACGDEIKAEAANGNGPVDAIYQAINRVTEYDVELVKYDLTAKGHGKDALGQVDIVVTHNGRRFHGVGLATDIVESSAKAMVHVLNNIWRAAEVEKELQRKAQNKENNKETV